MYEFVLFYLSEALNFSRKYIQLSKHFHLSKEFQYFLKLEICAWKPLKKKSFIIDLSFLFVFSAPSVVFRLYIIRAIPWRQWIISDMVWRDT